MNEFGFIAELLKKNWFQEINEKHDRKWTFNEDIKKLNDVELRNLVLIFCEIMELHPTDQDLDKTVEEIRKESAHNICNITLDCDLLVKFLKCVTLSEYMIDDILLYPPDMRFHAFERICKFIKLNQGIVRKIDSNWHSGIRKKVFAAD